MAVMVRTKPDVVSRLSRKVSKMPIAALILGSSPGQVNTQLAAA